MQKPAKFQSTNKIVIACYVIIGIAMLLASINPLEWSSYILHQMGTVIFMGIMLGCYRYFKVTAGSFVLASLFLLIHIVGARYLYSFVPYNEWSQQVFGFAINDVFGWERNMYDRLVHFSYGLLLFSFMFDCFKATFKHASLYQLLFIVLLLNLASSACYELFEWSLAMTMSSEDAEAYNGQQGDIWDAHSDMALALLGGIIAAVVKLLRSPNRLSNHRHNYHQE